MATATIEATGDNTVSKGKGLIFVWIAIFIFASANSIVLLLFDVGAANPIHGRNPVSFCNVLFAGNIVACVTMYIFYRKQWTKEALAKLTSGDWWSLIILAIITGALVPSLMFLALTNSSVTNTILVGRIEPIFLIILSMVVLKEKADVWPTIGAAIAFLGVAFTFYLESGGTGFSFGKGEMQAAGAAVLTAISTIVAKVRLKNIPLGIFTVIRTGLGAIIFLGVTIYLLGLEHFIDLGSPLLWQLMLIYGAVIVVGGQYFWFVGIKSANTGDVSVASSFTPIAGVAFAFLLLGEEPSNAVLIGGGVIVLGILVGQIGNFKDKLPNIPLLSTKYLMEREREVNFKGV
ncbi:MAG: DMT family transporter [Hyphomicrobiales bacterium]